MGQRHWVDISGGHAAYASTSRIDDGKGGGTNGVDSTVRESIRLNCSRQSVKEVGQVSLHWHWR